MERPRDGKNASSASPGRRTGDSGEGGPTAKLALLQAFELTCGGDLVALSPSMQRLLALLAVTGRGIDRTRLAGMLWGDMSDDRATANLRCQLWRLRRTGVPVVQAVGNQLRLDPSVDVDVQRATAQANRLLGRSGGPQQDDLDPQPLMYDLLEDWYDEWLLMERERFRQLRLHALEALCEKQMQAGRYPEAIEAGLAAVTGEPFRESAQRVLVRAYFAEGNPFEAERQYRAYQELLARHDMPEASFCLSKIEEDLRWERHHRRRAAEARSLGAHVVIEAAQVEVVDGVAANELQPS